MARDPIFGTELAQRILALCEAAVLIPTCAWCQQFNIDGHWVVPPGQKIGTGSVTLGLTHSICPSCLTAYHAADKRLGEDRA
jgi:hypothetical protein